ncbi:hypothetical protein RSWS8N_18034 [Cereibacter sphaeroides WS8N]|nr:hypothetical protein RSWS8N_18034 [Cereibacter sphaeroides WS8N]
MPADLNGRWQARQQRSWGAVRSIRLAAQSMAASLVENTGLTRSRAAFLTDQPFGVVTML